MTRKFLQDGPDFYRDDDEDYAVDADLLIASYPALVVGDGDLVGAMAARQQFLIDHPQYA